MLALGRVKLFAAEASIGVGVDGLEICCPAQTTHGAAFGGALGHALAAGVEKLLLGDAALAVAIEVGEGGRLPGPMGRAGCWAAAGKAKIMAARLAMQNSFMGAPEK